MKDLQLLDWDLLQLQYEILHEPVSAIAEANNVSPTTLQYAIEEKGWERKPISDIKESWSDLENIEEGIDGISGALQKRNDMVQLLKIANFNARYTNLESLAIAKIQDLLNGLDTSLPSAAAQMKDVIEAMQSLKELSEGSLNRSNDGSTSAIEPTRVYVNTLVQGEKPIETKTEIDNPKVPELKNVNRASI